MGEMVCPKCGHKQLEAQECVKCGIVVEKYLALQKNKAEAKPSPDIPSKQQPIQQVMCLECHATYKIPKSKIPPEGIHATCKQCGTKIYIKPEEEKTNAESARGDVTAASPESLQRHGGLDKKQILGILGSLILFVGVFTPIINFPVVGSLNYFQGGKGDGVIVLILAVISLLLTIIKKYKGLWFTGIASLGVLAFTFIIFHMKIAEAKAKMELELAGNPFKGLADMALHSIQLRWGWAILVVGAVLVIAAAAIKQDASKR